MALNSRKIDPKTDPHPIRWVVAVIFYLAGTITSNGITVSSALVMVTLGGVGFSLMEWIINKEAELRK